MKLADGGEMGFLIPYDAKVDMRNPDHRGPYLATCIAMDHLWSYLEAGPARHSLLIAEAMADSIPLSNCYRTAHTFPISHRKDQGVLPLKRHRQPGRALGCNLDAVARLLQPSSYDSCNDWLVFHQRHSHLQILRLLLSLLLACARWMKPT